MDVRLIQDDLDYELEIDGQIQIKKGKDLKSFIITMRKQINFRLEQTEILLTENKQDARDL